MNKSPIPPHVKEAISSWTNYVEHAESLVYLTYDGLSRVQKIPQLNEILFEGDTKTWTAKQRKQDLRKARLAEKEANDGFPHLHAHSLLGLWGAFECFIEDMVISVMESRPSVLENPVFDKVKIPVSTLAISDSYERTASIFFEASKSGGSDLSLGVAKFERQLKFAGLDGAVPPRIADNIFLAQQIRNIWAHRGGKADAKLITRCPQLGLKIGEKVLLNHESFTPLMHSIHMYSLVVVNRFRRIDGRELIFSGCSGFEGVFDDATLNSTVTANKDNCP